MFFDCLIKVNPAINLNDQPFFVIGCLKSWAFRKISSPASKCKR
jgi:hypothetical protein